MFESQIVFLKIGVMFLVMLVGWWARHRGYLDAAICRSLGVFVVEAAFPALVFTQMIATVSESSLRQGWWLPLLAAAALLLAGGIGHVLAGIFRINPASRGTFVFIIAVPNWVFLPLPIAEALYGAEGIRIVLLFNVGAQIILWTAAVRLLVGRSPARTAWRAVLMNPGLLATFAGAGVVLLWPEAATLGRMQAGGGPRLFAEMMDGALKMLGSLTIPLSLLVTGAQLGGLARSGRFDLRALTGVMVGRLLVAPIVTLVLIRLASWGFGLPLTPAEFITIAVIVTMPVAISCTMFVERFGGNAGLSATGIFYSTLLSLVTVPLIVLICRVWVL